MAYTNGKQSEVQNEYDGPIQRLLSKPSNKILIYSAIGNLLLVFAGVVSSIVGWSTMAGLFGTMAVIFIGMTVVGWFLLLILMKSGY